MKKILLATTLLAASTGFAAAEVTLSGDARMGVLSGFDVASTPLVDEGRLVFESRARVKFTLSGSTDGGLEFGASFRAQDAASASSGKKGSVFISGAFGKLSMGDVDDAANTAVGQVSGVGLTGLGDLNEATYIAGGIKPSALYEYSTGDLTIYASVGSPVIAAVSTTPYSVAAKYALGDYTVALGYEDNDVGTTHIIGGVSATFGAATLKAIYGSADGVIKGDQYAVSVDYKADALTVTAFYSNKDLVTLPATSSIIQEAYGIGASYDLGGGASVVGGYSQNLTTDQGSYDLGVSMSF